MGKQLPGMQSPMPGGVTPGQPPQRGAFGSLGGGSVMGGGQQAPMVAQQQQMQAPQIYALNQQLQALGRPGMLGFSPEQMQQQMGGQQLPTQTGAQQLQQLQQLQQPKQKQVGAGYSPEMQAYFAQADPRYAFSQFMQQQQQQAPQLGALNPATMDGLRQQQQQMGGQQLPTQTGAQQPQQRQVGAVPSPAMPAFNPTQAMNSFSADLARRVKSGAMTAQQAQQAQSQFRNQVQLNTQTPQTRQGAEAAARNIMQGVMKPPPPPGFNMGGEAMEDPRMQAMRYIQQLANQQRGY